MKNVLLLLLVFLMFACSQETTKNSTKSDADYTATESTRSTSKEAKDLNPYRGDAVETAPASTRLDEVVVTKSSKSKKDKAGSHRYSPPPPPPLADMPTKSVEAVTATSAGVVSSDKAEAKRAKRAAIEREASRLESTITTRDGLTAEGKIAIEDFEPEPIDPNKAGILTAGEVNDFSKWDLWTDMSQEDLFEYAERWEMLPEHRYAVQVRTKDGSPMINKKVELQSSTGAVLWTGRTDNTGKTELWHKLVDKDQANASKIVAHYDGKTIALDAITAFKEGINIIEIPVECSKLTPKIDIAFVVDATGSMRDEIAYLKAELNDVIQKVKNNMPDSEVRLGSVFYRDHGDAYLTRKSELSNNISKTIEFIQKQGADGGGDFPEAVEDAMEVALNDLGWSDESTSRMLFLILDAPPHTSPETKARIKKVTQLAAEKGVRVIPITCSGIRKSTEYLMRTMALASNGTYTFLTDDSGVGGSHIEPSTDQYDVELLNDLIVRLITQFSEIKDCDEDFADDIQDIINDQNNNQNDNNIVWEYYPNPTKGKFTIKAEEEMQEVLIADMNGKLLIRRQSKAMSYDLDINQFSAGVYLIKCRFGKDNWEGGRIVLIHER